MDLRLDSGKLLYGIGVLLAFAALAYFVRDLVFGLSITVKAALLFLGFLAFFAAGTATDRDVLDAVAFAVSGGAYLVFLWYVNANYPLGDTGTFLTLAASAALFVGLGYLLREREFELPARTAGSVVLALALAGLVLVGADAVGGDVTYAVAPADSVTVDPPTDRYGDGRAPGQEVRVGTITATNPSVFRQSLDPPRPSACVVDADGVVDGGHYVDLRAPGETYGYPDSVGGRQSVPIHMSVGVERHANQTDATTYAVERAPACPTDVDRPTIAITFDEGDGPSLRPDPA